jgi:ribosomal protein S8
MFYKITNIVKLNYMLKRNKIKIKLNKNDFKIIKIFIKLNIIKNIKKNKNNFYIYFRYVKNNPVFYSIKNIYKPSKPVFINFKEIKKINKKNNSIFILSTNKGLITNFEAEKNKTGGIIITLIHI